MWYDKAVKAYMDHTAEDRAERARILKEKFKECFGEDIDPVFGVYQLAYEDKNLVFYVDECNLRAAYLWCGEWWVSPVIKDANTAGKVLLLADLWVFCCCFPHYFIYDLLCAYPEGGYASDN